MYKFINRISFLILVFVIFSHTTHLSASYNVQRQAFPAFCSDCFQNNKSSQKTWIEPCDSHFIDSLKEYLEFIPKTYFNDCRPCGECGGIGYCLYNGFDFPADIDVLEEITRTHQYLTYGRLDWCKVGINFHGELGGNSNDIKCWDGGYFRLWNHKYSHFFKHYLHYCSENRTCRCYWPERCLKANRINDKVYEFIKELCELELIDSSFSPYWSAQKIEFGRKIKYFDEHYYPNSHGMASSLTTYTFLYSQYHQLLLSIAAYIDENAIRNEFEALDSIYELLEELQEDFLKLYNICLGKHPHPKIYYERGMVNLHSGNLEESLNDVYQLSQLVNSGNFDSEMTSEIYQQEGKSYNEFGIYDKAVVALTKAINLDTENKEAYFERAYAHFELGNFEEALSDYSYSETSKKLSNIKQKPSDLFCFSVLAGITEGSADAALDFVPSLLDSTSGLSETLWTTALHPIDNVINFYNISYDVANDVVDYFNDFDWDKAEDYSEELKDFCCSFYELSDAEKGKKLGVLIGKNGTDILMGGTAVKGFNNLKKLKNANALCNLEAALLSKKNKKTIVSAAKNHATRRGEYFKNVKIVADSQNKHIIGKHNYLPGRSLFEHNDAQKLLDKFAGTGVRVGKELPGTPGYKELVDFKEHIGIWKNKEGTLALPSTKGTIHYSKKGAHIVPSHPDTQLK